MTTTCRAGISPTPHLLWTNDPPTEPERINIQSSINEAREHRKVVFENTKYRFLRAESDKEYLENLAELLLLDEFIYNHQSLLSPLRYLPPELLAEILLHSTSCERHFETDLCGAVWEPDYKYILGLSQVSRYWRRVAVATQGLWTSIPALRKWQSDVPEPEALLQLMRIFIKRSGNAPIHVTVLVDDVFNDLEGAPLESQCLDLLASQCYRWKTAILHIDISMVESLVRLDAPILDSLNFRCRYPAGLMFTPNRSWPQLLVLAPRLRHAIVDGWQSHSFLQFLWNKISTFIGLPENLEIMRPAGPSLKACTFRGPVSMMLYPVEPIQFNELRFLHIKNDNYQPPSFHFGQEFETPFRWMAVPNLEVLFVKGHPVYRDASLIVRDLLLTTLPSSSALRFLRFHVRGLTEDDFKNLLSATPLLEDLDICDTPSHYFSHLIRQDPVTLDDLHQPLVPKLKWLEIRNFSDSYAAPLVALCASCRVKKGRRIGDLNISLSYSSVDQCLRAQNRVEGWDEIVKRECVPGSELTKVLGWATFVAKQFLGRSGRAKKYGFILKANYAFQPASQLDVVLKLIEQHQFSKPVFVEISHLRDMMKDVSEMSPDDLPNDIYNFQGRTAELVFMWTDIHSGWHPKWTRCFETLRLWSVV